MKYTSRAVLLIAAGESIKMQEKAGIEPMCKTNKRLSKCASYHFDDTECTNYEFPLAVVEGKPVFVGDELYCEDGFLHSANKNLNYNHPWSWTKPKSKTVMVELPIEDVEQIAKPYVYITVSNEGIVACRKALEKA